MADEPAMDSPGWEAQADGVRLRASDIAAALMGGVAMCQACWAMASRRFGDAAFVSDAVPDAPRSRFTSVAEWVSEPLEDDRRADLAARPSSPTDAQDA
jgi:hypothetical protein